MARRRTTKRKRRVSRIPSVLNLAEGYIQASILLKGATGASNPVGFFLPGMGYGSSGVSLQSIVQNPQASLDAIGTRLMNPQNVLQIAGESFLANVGFRFAKRALRRPIGMVNRSITPLALGVKL